MKREIPEPYVRRPTYRDPTPYSAIYGKEDQPQLIHNQPEPERPDDSLMLTREKLKIEPIKTIIVERVNHGAHSIEIHRTRTEDDLHPSPNPNLHTKLPDIQGSTGLFDRKARIATIEYEIAKLRRLYKDKKIREEEFQQRRRPLVDEVKSLKENGWARQDSNL